MSEFRQMLQRQFGSVTMVQHNVGDALILRVPWNRNRRHGQRVRKIEIQRNNAFGPALKQQSRILFEKLAIVPVDASNKEISFLPRAIFNPGNHRRTIPIADLMSDHSNGESPLPPQRLGKKIRPVIQFSRSSNNAFARDFRNVLG